MYEGPPKREAHSFYEQGTHRMRDYIEIAAAKLRDEAVPVDAKLRIRMDDFVREPGYSLQSIKADKDECERLKQIMDPDLSPEEREKRSARKLGTQFEEYKTAIFTKYLSNDFIVCRTSEFDDIKRGSDNILVDRRTGRTICAIDEVTESPAWAASSSAGQPSRAEVKIQKIKERNADKNGTRLKYGIMLESTRDGMVLRKRSLNNLPMFYLSIDAKRLREAITIFDDNVTSPRAFEVAVFQDLIQSLVRQIEGLKAIYGYEGRPKGMREAVEGFEIGLRRHIRDAEKEAA